MLNCISLCTFKLFCVLWCGHAFKHAAAIIALTTPTVSYIMSLFSIFYTSSFFKPLFLLQSPLKRLLLLRSMVWPLLPCSLTIKTSFSGVLLSFVISLLLGFFGTAKVYQFQSAILLFGYLLQQPLYWSSFSLFSILLLVNPVVYLNCLVNKFLYILWIVFKYQCILDF